MQNLTSKIESLLFVSSKPLTVKELAKLLEKTTQEIKASLNELVEHKKDAGVIVLENGEEYQLATNSANSTEVKNFMNAELREKLTDATVEVLAIIAYRQPISKAEIEAIRGVNSQYSVRHLLMRGLIEKVSNPHDARSSLYQTTTEFLQHLGLSSTKDLPDFEKLVEQIKLPEIIEPAKDSEDTPQPGENFSAISQGPAQAETLPQKLTPKDMEGAEFKNENETPIQDLPSDKVDDDEFEDDENDEEEE